MSRAMTPEQRERYLAQKRADYAADPGKFKARVKAYRERNRAAVLAKERARSRGRNRPDMLMRHYGMTEDDYQARVAEQHGRCGICAKHHSEVGRLVVDHCHESGVVRGLLCHGCNLAIGRLGDTAAAMQRAYRYLARFEDTRRLCA